MLEVLKIMVPKAMMIIGGGALFSLFLEVKFEKVAAFLFLADYLFTISAMGILLKKTADGVLQTDEVVIKWMETSNLVRKDMWKVIHAILETNKSKKSQTHEGGPIPGMRGLPEEGH